MTVDFTNPYYYMYPVLGIAVFFALYFILRGRTAKTQSAVLFIVLLLNFVLHFTKLAFPPYTDMAREDALQTITPENVCAINTMIFPFLFLKRKGVARDYMFYIGIISGVAASWLPMSIEDAGPFDFDCIRYYFCHTTLWVVPLLMVVLRLHELNYRRIWMVPLIYLLDLAVIVVNEVVLVALGLDSERYLMSAGHGNGGMAFAPYPSMEGSAALDILLAIVPDCFTPAGTGEYYVPVLWQLFPAYILGCPVGFLLCLYWEHKRFLSDVKRLADAVKLQVKAFRFGRRKVKFRPPVKKARARLRR